jgi:hypothetical protein
MDILQKTKLPFFNQINMPRTKNNYKSAMLQRRVPEELKPELDEIITNRLASFKREQAAKQRMEQQMREARNA